MRRALDNPPIIEAVVYWILHSRGNTFSLALAYLYFTRMTWRVLFLSRQERFPRLHPKGAGLASRLSSTSDTVVASLLTTIGDHVSCLRSSVARRVLVMPRQSLSRSSALF